MSSKWTQDKVEAHFLDAYVADDGFGGTYLREVDGRPCAAQHEVEQPAAVALVDYEDERSGGMPMCARCFTRALLEDDEANVGSPEASWGEWVKGGTWFLFAAPRVFEKGGEWPYDSGESLAPTLEP